MIACQHNHSLITDLIPNQTSDLFDDAQQRIREMVQHGGTLALVLAITMIVALIGNLFLAFLLRKMSNGRRMGPVQILIFHTCMADICFALCTILPQMASLITLPHFYGGDILCRLVKYIQLIPMIASPYLLVAISIDRYVAICKPLVVLKWKYRLVHTLACAAWTAAFLFSTPNIFAFGSVVIENNTSTTCMYKMDDVFEKAWIGLFSLMVWLLPSIIVAVLYSFVCVAVWKSMRQSGKYVGIRPYQREEPPSPNANDGQGHNSRKPSPTAYECLIRVSPCPKRKSSTSSINSYTLKTVKLTMTIVIANFVLWAPFCISNVIGTYFRDIQIDDMVTTCIMLVGNANSCVNPWIYIVFNYKRVLNVLFGDGQTQENSSRNQARPSTTVLSKTTTPAANQQRLPVNSPTKHADICTNAKKSNITSKSKKTAYGSTNVGILATKRRNCPTYV